MTKSILAIIPVTLFLVGCAAEKKEPVMTYDQNSWETMIEDSCRSYFDGCNNCIRGSDDSNLAACTRKFCQHYEEPRCLDDES